MKGVNHIMGMDSSVSQLTHMFGHCLFRFETEIGCKGCKYNNVDDTEDTCALLDISNTLRANTMDSYNGNQLIRKVM